MTLEIPAVAIVKSAPLPPRTVASKSRVSPFVYAEPPEIISTPVTSLPDTVTLAVAPSQVLVPSFSNLTFWYVPLVYPLPPVRELKVTIPLKLWFLAKVSVATPTAFDVNAVVIPVIECPIPREGKMLSIVSLVRLFLRSLVLTSPRGALRA